MKHVFMATALVLSCSAAALAAPIPLTNPKPKIMVEVDGAWYPVKGLKEVSGEKLIGFLKRKVYVYDLEGTKTLYLTYTPIKASGDLKVKDERPDEIAHPIRTFVLKYAGSAIAVGAWFGTRFGINK